MKKKEIKELKNKSIDELLNQVESLRQDVAKARFDIKLGKEKNTAKIKNMRKDIARILTTVSNLKFETNLQKEKNEIEERKESLEA